MRLSNETYESIKQAVADMFVDYDGKSVPICSFEVAVKIGLTIIPYSALTSRQLEEALEYSSDGYSVETIENEWIIYYNDEVKNYTRINQTIMHEIGHYILGHISEGEEEEAEAKFFAKYALASPVLIKNMPESITVENVMNRFAIGYQAAVYALDNYRKRFQFGPVDYVIYEKQILNQMNLEAGLGKGAVKLRVLNKKKHITNCLRQ